MHLFLRDVLRLPFVACLVGSIAFLFGFWHYIYGFAALGVPLGLWLADRAIRPGPRRWLAVTGWIAFDGFLLYAGLSQVVLISGLLQLGWLLFATPDGPRADRPARLVGGRLGGQRRAERPGAPGPAPLPPDLRARRLEPRRHLRRPAAPRDRRYAVAVQRNPVRAAARGGDRRLGGSLRDVLPRGRRARSRARRDCRRGPPPVRPALGRGGRPDRPDPADRSGVRAADADPAGARLPPILPARPDPAPDAVRARRGRGDRGGRHFARTRAPTGCARGCDRDESVSLRSASSSSP